MKKMWVLVIIIALLATGCSSNNGENGNNAGASNTAEASNTALASGASSGDEVTLVFPASLNTGDVEGMTAEVKEAGATNVVENSNGSVSVAISKENLNTLLKKYHSELLNVIEGINSADENASSIKKLDYNKDTFQEYSITVDKAAYESEDNMDGLVIFALAMQSMMYQVYSGVQEADITVTFNMIDESTGEVFETSVLPEATTAQ